MSDQVPVCVGVSSLQDETNTEDYDCAFVPLTNQNWRKRWERYCVSSEDMRPTEETSREAEQWRSSPGFIADELNVNIAESKAGKIIVSAADWLELDASDEGIRFDSEHALKQEVAHAAFLNIPTIMLPAPRNRKYVAEYARAVNACLAETQRIQISVCIPVSDPIELRKANLRSRFGPGQNVFQASNGPSVPPPQQVFMGDPSSTWEIWDAIRTLCDYNPRLNLTLDLSQPLPPPAALARWSAEPTRGIMLPASAFISNSKGYPVLLKTCQAYLKDTFKYRPSIILTGTKDSLHQAGGPLAYLRYIRHLNAKSSEASSVEDISRGYSDLLQAPLQPLMNHLDSNTYDNFEKCPVKYAKYEQAVTAALDDRHPSDFTTIYVLGAGRGPLVSNCLSAIRKSKRRCRVIAVEKNPHAFVTLQDRQRDEWSHEDVRLICADMRDLNVPDVDRADIVVSELLGSFGDNELSPECLDGAMRIMKPDGISIPSTYAAHLAPLSSSKVYNEVRQSSSTEGKQAETPYVVMLQAVNILSGSGGGRSGRCGDRIQQCWFFDHPKREMPLDDNGVPLGNSHNTRAAHLTFHIPHAGALHGFAGYFEAQLYHDIWLSIHPDRADIDMISWFPLLFPLREPLYLPSNSELDVHIWRLTDKNRVWYEWSAEAFLPLPPIVAPASPITIASSTLAAVDIANRGAPSPMLDAQMPRELPPILIPSSYSQSESEVEPRLKISHTTLHNPQGRSSFIGL